MCGNDFNMGISSRKADDIGSPPPAKSTAPPPPIPPTKEASPMTALTARNSLLARVSHPTPSLPSENLDEASVLHMTDLLTRKHASDSVREYILSASAEMEYERERRLQAAAVNVVAFRRRVPAVQGHPLFEVAKNAGPGSTERPTSAMLPKVLPAEEEITIRLIKGERPSRIRVIR